MTHHSTISALHHLQMVHALRPRMDIALALITSMVRYFGPSVPQFMSSEDERFTDIQYFIVHARYVCDNDRPEPNNENLLYVIWYLLQWQTIQMSTASLRDLRWPQQWAENPLLRSALGTQSTFNNFNQLAFRQILIEMQVLHQTLTFHTNILNRLITYIPEQDMATIPWDLEQYITLSRDV
jgi:hypothetical protein